MNKDSAEHSPTVDERKTRELCGEEHDGLRCMRPKGHVSDHEAFHASELITWSLWRQMTPPAK